MIRAHTHTHARTHTHTPVKRPLVQDYPGWAGTRKVKPVRILLEQETVSGNGISWAICKFASRSKQITMPAPYHSVFLQAGCPSCRQTNSVKALKAIWTVPHLNITLGWLRQQHMLNISYRTAALLLMNVLLKWSYGWGANPYENHLGLGSSIFIPDAPSSSVKASNE